MRKRSTRSRWITRVSRPKSQKGTSGSKGIDGLKGAEGGRGEMGWPGPPGREGYQGLKEAALRINPDIVIATNCYCRLIDHLWNTPSFCLSSVEVLIPDEADRMLDEYFEEQMTEIIKQCCRSRQTLLFSATMSVNSLAAVSLSKPVRLFVDNNQDVASNLWQEFVRVCKDMEGDREPLLAALVCRTFHDHCMVFVQTKNKPTGSIFFLASWGLSEGIPGLPKQQSSQNILKN